jgi:surfactin synthase thioesterase subunit
LGYLRQGGKKLLIFGHSFGSLIGYELACVLRRVFHYTPHYFVVAAGIAPKVRRVVPLLSPSWWW